MPFLAGKSSSQQAFLQLLGFRDMDCVAVELRPFSLLRDEEFIARGIVNHPCDARTFCARTMFQGHGDAENRISMSEIRGSVHRVDVPAVFAAAIVQPLLFS